MKFFFKFLKLSFVLLIMMHTSLLHAVPPTTNPLDSSNNENRLYAGIVFDLDGSDGFMPDLVLGVRSLHVKSNNDVDGAEIGRAHV